MGPLIVIDGLDGSGKETQSKKLTEYLTGLGIRCRYLTFPDYEAESSALVRLYLSGALGDDPADTGPYAASSFYAMDRYVSYRTKWEKDYADENTVLVANRYTTANAVHQLSKLPREEWDPFLMWLWDYEFEKLGLPKPDLVLYLEMLPEISRRLIENRCQTAGAVRDIHEKDAHHLENSYAAALYASDTLGWQRIRCYDEARKEPLSREAIFSAILSCIPKALLPH